MATEEEDRNPEPTEQEKEQMAEIKKISEEVTEQNKKRDDSYDDKIKSLETRKKLLPTDERAEEEHLARVTADAIRLIDAKYRKGAAEHHGELLQVPALEILDQAIDEAIDQVVYLLSLKEKLLKELTHAAP